MVGLIFFNGSEKYNFLGIFWIVKFNNLSSLFVGNYLTQV